MPLILLDEFKYILCFGSTIAQGEIYREYRRI